MKNGFLEFLSSFVCCRKDERNNDDYRKAESVVNTASGAETEDFVSPKPVDNPNTILSFLRLVNSSNPTHSVSR